MQTQTAPRTPSTNKFFKRRQNIAVKAQLGLPSGQTPIKGYKRLFGGSIDGIFEEFSRPGCGQNIFANHGHLQTMVGRKRGATKSGILDFEVQIRTRRGNRTNGADGAQETGNF